jgi:hypothetical protein
MRAIPTPLLRYLPGLEEWLVFEVNDYLRSIRPPTDLRDELS